MPSVEEAAVLEYDATATKVLFPKVTEDHLPYDGSVLKVQVMPSVEEAAVLEYAETVTKVLLA